jgi:hypothetical protein
MGSIGGGELEINRSEWKIVSKSYIVIERQKMK